jgi:hypothetical protein
MNAKERRRRTLEEAWIGDAVLCLYCRGRILKNDGALDGDKFNRMTSNQFLSAFGEPSEVEAEIGRVYSDDGLQAAFAWIEAKLMPRFDKREAKRNPPRPAPRAGQGTLT